MIEKRVIALRRKNRLDQFFSRPGAAGFEVFWGVDGRSDAPEKVFDRERFTRHYGMEPSPGRMGCALSHAKLMAEFAAGSGSDSDLLLVAEDDALLSPFLDAVIDSLSQRAPIDFIVLNHLSAGTRKPHVCSPTERERQISAMSRPILATSSGRRKIFRVGPYAGVLWGAGLYLVSRKAARVYSCHSDYGARVSWLADDLNRFYFEMGLNALVLKPGLCDWVGDSISSNRDSEYMDELHSVSVDTWRERLAPRMRINKAKLVALATADHVFGTSVGKLWR